MLADKAELRQAMKGELHEKEFGSSVLMFMKLTDEFSKPRDTFQSFLKLRLWHVVKQVNAVAIAKPVRDFFIRAFLLLLSEFVRVNDQSIKASREVREIARRSQAKKDIRFHYGEHEQLLMQYLDMNPSITLKQFMQVSGLKKFYASKKLVLLVLANVLEITPHEKGDLFSLAFGKEKRE